MLKVWLGYVVLVMAVLYATRHFAWAQGPAGTVTWALMIALFVYLLTVRNFSLRQEGDKIVFRMKGRVMEKPVTAKVDKVIEWHGSEGTLYDIVWQDGDIWTVPNVLGLAKVRIKQALQKTGSLHFEPQNRVFRPESAND